MQRKKLIRRAVGVAAVCLALGAPTLHMTAHAHGRTGESGTRTSQPTGDSVDTYLKARAPK